MSIADDSRRIRDRFRRWWRLTVEDQTTFGGDIIITARRKDDCVRVVIEGWHAWELARTGSLMAYVEECVDEVRFHCGARRPAA